MKININHTYIPDKKETQHIKLIYSQVDHKFRLYRCKGMSVTAALHIFRSQWSKMR